MYFFYVASGGTLNVSSGGLAHVIREPGSIVNYGPSANPTVFDCPAVALDTSALAAACP
jgi:hypothetical protein